MPNFIKQLTGPMIGIPSLDSDHRESDRPPMLPQLAVQNSQPQVNQNIAIDPSGGISYFQTPKQQSTIGDFRRRYGSKDEQSQST
jgi:hypothetical protein